MSLEGASILYGLGVHPIWIKGVRFDYFLDRAVRSSVYRAVVQLGLLQRQVLAERVYGGRAKLAVSSVSVSL